MDNIPTKFEELPNEILIDLFQYFDARNLFQIFYNLNYRLNTLIQYFRHLNLIFYMESFIDNQISSNYLFPFYIRTLIVGRAININLDRFSNIHYLKLECPLKRVLAQLNSNELPYLQQLTISHIDTLTTVDEWKSLPSLHILKVSRITLLVYKTILTACPNLISFELSIFSSDKSKLNIEPHINLKRLVIDIGDLIWPWSDHSFDSYLSCVPNLEKFHVYRSIFISKVTESLLEYDWLASKITRYLLSLHRFNFYFKIIQSHIYMKSDILCQIKEKFLNSHTDRYQSRLTTNKYKSRLEDLPNELLTDIFKQLDAQNLFRSFYNLNKRLNQLVQAFNYLQLTFHMNQSNVLKTNGEIYSFYVHTLIVDPWIDFNLIHFPNVRRLTLNSPFPKVIEQLKANVVPYLEHLSVFYTYNMYEINILHNEIFSNRFPNLISCELLENRTLMTIQKSTQSPLIRILKTKFINLSIYEKILSVCPNLYFLKFSMHSSNELLPNVQLHKNLKYMIVDQSETDWFDDEFTLSEFLARVPNLEQLVFHRRNYSRNIVNEFEQYDWLVSIINFRLPFIRKLKFHLYLSSDENVNGVIDKNILTKIQSDFTNVHKGQYKAQLEIHLKPL
ncbi:unnamed protein product [Adineta steineri]|uniref:F-box domain-containing protein n=2 Tax=Adineta steineri TaxID=433720 RepID=A0A819GYS1_9BILA|nr:unnamed protein product [Adineta steineri]CAF3894474.1 unnamed protein product [Adineta steineri]